MHLVILTQYYPPEIGAAQTRLSDIAQRMVQRGHTVTVLTAMPSYPTGKIHPGYGGIIRRERLAGVDVVRTFIYPTRKADIVPRLLNYFSFVLSSATLGSFLLGDVDYLLVESPPLFLGLAGFWLSRVNRARMIFNVADLWPDAFVTLGKLRSGDLAYRMSSKLEEFCYGQAWLVTGQTKGIVANINERFPARPIFHLSNGVNPKVYHPERKTKTARAKLTARDGDFVAIYAGLHGLSQGLDQVLVAAEILRNEADLRFVFVGDGPEKRALLEKAENHDLTNVHFLEPCPASEVPPLLASADVGLVVLKTDIPEAAPSKMYEAMASGLPVVLVASGEAADIVREHNAGVVIAPGDTAGLAQAVQILRKRPDLRTKFGANGRQAAESYFDRTNIVARFIEHLETNLQA